MALDSLDIYFNSRYLSFMVVLLPMVATATRLYALDTSIRHRLLSLYTYTKFTYKRTSISAYCIYIYTWSNRIWDDWWYFIRTDVRHLAQYSPTKFIRSESDLLCLLQVLAPSFHINKLSQPFNHFFVVYIFFRNKIENIAC